MLIAIKTTDLTKKFKHKTAVHALNISIGQGELFGLLGVNGAGKTTTIKMLTCLLHPTSGDAQLFGNSIIADAQAIKQIINVSPQETAVARNLTVWENLLLIARVYGFHKDAAREKVAKIIDDFSLEEVKDAKTKILSGGMQRRLSIAMALISEPRILFLDEPTLGLDVLARRELWTAIKRLKGKVTIVLTTHYMEEAQALADRIGIMVKGKMAAVGTVSELIEQAALGVANTLEDAFIALSTQEDGAL